MSEGINLNKRSAVFTDLGVLEYKRALELQLQTVNRKIEYPDFSDQLFFIQHPPVFTLGKRGGRENLIVSDSFLQDKNVDIIETRRGGNITYHGPGQAVLYPVVDLENHKIAVKDFVFGLEEIMKRTAMKFGIQAKRDPRNHGIWIGNSKIGSVGIAIKKGISFHGLAMNINPDLTPFSWINPCGLKHTSITSIEKERIDSDRSHGTSGSGPDHQMISTVKDLFIRYFSEIFNFEIKRHEN